jgi:hypothetical protein
MEPFLHATLIGYGSINAFYYSHPHSSYNHIVGAVTLLAVTSEDSWQPLVRPFYQSLGLTRNLPAYDWYYSDAPLSGVRRVQLCMDGENCIGLQLQYDGHRRAVGQFRLDKVIWDYPDEPHYIGLTRTQPDCGSFLRVIFSPTQDDCRFQPMAGAIVWWYGKDTSEVSLLY